MLNLKKHKTWLILIIIVAALLRLGYLIEYRLKSPLYTHPVTDSYMYMNWAREIANGNWLGSKVFWQAPFYPYFLALVLLVFEQPFTFVYLFQFIVGLFNLVLIYSLGAKTITKTAGIFAVIICCFYAPFIYYEAKLLADTFGIFFMLLSLNFTLRALEEKKDRDFLLAGLFLGIGCVVRAFYLLYFVLSVLGLYIALRKQSQDYIKKAVVYAVSCIAVISIVTIRNYAVGKDFVAVSYSSGVTFYHGNNPYANGGYGPGVARYIPAAEEEAESKKIAEKELGILLKPSQVSNFWIKKGVLFFLNSPGRAYWLLQRKFMLSLNNSESDAAYHMLTEKEFITFLHLIFLPFGIISAFGICGMVLAWKKFKTLWPFYLFVAAMYATLYIFYVSSRYRLHSIPLLAIFAGFGIEGFLRLWEEKNIKDLSVLFVLCLVILLFSHIPIGAYLSTAASRLNLGFAYLESGNRDKAMECFVKTTQISPSFTPAWMAIGDVYYAEGQYREALNEYEQVIRQGQSRQYDRALERAEKCRQNILLNAVRH